MQLHLWELIMAIIIPSKNIYEINNPKIRDNFVDNVSIDYTAITPNNEFETIIYGGDLPLDNISTTASNEGKKGYIFPQTDHTHTDYPIVSTKIINKYATINEIRIPKLKNNYYVSNIYNTKNASTGSSYTQIKKYLNEEIYSYQVEDSFNFTDNAVYGGDFNYDKIVAYTPTVANLLSTKRINDFVGRKVTYSVDNRTENEFANNWNSSISDYQSADIYNEITYTNVDMLKLAATVKNSLDFPKDNDFSNLTIDSESDSDNYIIKNLTIYVGRTLYACATGLCIPAPTMNYVGRKFPSKVVEIQQNVSKAEITIYGDTIGIDLSDGNITYRLDEKQGTIEGTGEKPFSLSGNELLQDNNKRIKLLASDILNQYRNGKETVTLLCDINDYYDKNGEKKISIDEATLPMTFSIGDICIPKIYGADGVDIPLSTHPNGDEKTYRVVGVEPYSSGAVWQKIFLQEV